MLNAIDSVSMLKRLWFYAYNVTDAIDPASMLIKEKDYASMVIMSLSIDLYYVSVLNILNCYNLQNQVSWITN